jgi:hypothetical protein
MHSRIVTLTALLTLVAAACGSDDPDPADAGSTVAPAATAAPGTTARATSAPVASGPATTSASRLPGAPEAELTIVAGTQADPAALGEATLACAAGGASGTAWLAGDAAAAACSALADESVYGALVNPPDPDLACTEIYGGDDVAAITGTIAPSGDTSGMAIAVDAHLDRTNGCAIARWDELAPLLVAVGAGGD